MRYHRRFEWDAAKDAENRRKHRVSFADAADVLFDPDAARFHVEEYDAEHSRTEERWITTGSHPLDRSIVFRIVWTARGEATRIISARIVTAAERVEYEKQTFT